MTETAEQSTTDQTATQIADGWLSGLQSALTASNAGEVTSLFAASATFRDLLAFSWNFRSLVGAAEIAAELTDPSGPARPRQLRLRANSAPQFQSQGEDRFLLVFFECEVDAGRAEGFAQLLVSGDERPHAVGVVVQLAELDGHPETTGENRPIGKQHGPRPGRRAWADDQDPDFRTSEPKVVVIGAGHNGLMIAARLGRLGVSALVIDRNERVGDNWRKRYGSLALHDPVGADHLPYLPLPSSWPKFTPKDKYADYLEAYARLLDIPVWTGASVSDVRQVRDGRKWALAVTRSDGEVRHLTPNHLIVATGANNIPNMPDLPGASEFGGDTFHSSEYPGGEKWAGKRVVVVGTGVSGHDVAQDLAERGAEVTMIQRSPTVVVDGPTFHALSFGTFTEDGPATADADLMGAMVPFGLYPSLGPGHLAAAKAADEKLLAGLEAAGFRVGEGPDGQGVLGLVFREAKASYYYNIGASELIIDGTIAVAQGSVDRFTPDGVKLDDGTALNADLVVFATGYRSIEDSARPLLGDAIVDELGDFSRVGDDLEYRGLWRPSGKEGLWFMIALGIFYGRFYSKLLALQIKAIEEGLVQDS